MSSSDPVNSEDVVFREARDEDLPAILALLGDDLLGKYRELVLPEHADIPAAYKAAFEAIAADPRNQLYVAEIGGAVAGCFQLTFIPGLTYQGGERAQIEGVRVSQAIRGRGVGKAMMQYAIARARARGCALVQLTTDKRRAEAHEFYRALGFAGSHVGMKLLM
jgi:ribosomal protein S18 acetylase RimI-like enzyme